MNSLRLTRLTLTCWRVNEREEDQTNVVSLQVTDRRLFCWNCLKCNNGKCMCDNMTLFWVQNSNVWIHQNLNSPKVQIHRILDWIYRNLSNFSKYCIHWTVEFVETLNSTNLLNLLNLSKPAVRRSFIFVEPLHLANYQIHRTSEFIEISNSWKPQIYRILDRVSVQSFTFVEAPQTPARCSPFQNGGRGQIPGET